MLCRAEHGVEQDASSPGSPSGSGHTLCTAASLRYLGCWWSRLRPGQIRSSVSLTLPCLLSASKGAANRPSDSSETLLGGVPAAGHTPWTAITGSWIPDLSEEKWSASSSAEFQPICCLITWASAVKTGWCVNVPGPVFSAYFCAFGVLVLSSTHDS